MIIYIIEYNQRDGMGWKIAMDVFTDRERAIAYAETLAEGFGLDMENDILLFPRRVLD